MSATTGDTGSLSDRFAEVRAAFGTPQTRVPSNTNVVATLQRTVLRHRLVTAHFQDGAAARHYIFARFDDPAESERYVQRAVAENQTVIATLATGDAFPNLGDKPLYAQYTALVNTHYVDPGEFFDDIPRHTPVCQLAEVLRLVKNDDRYAEFATDIRAQWTASITYLRNRFEQLTGRPWDANTVPRLGELRSRKGPIPWTTRWSSTLRGLESTLRSASATEGESADVAGTMSENEVTASEADLGAVSGAESDTPCSCDIAEIYRLAGARPPHAPGDTDVKYTFPGRLGTDEDIFYDYAVVLPMEECALPDEPTLQPRRREVATAHLLVGKAFVVLDFLQTMHLDDALGAIGPNPGDTAIDRLRTLFDDVLAANEATAAADIVALRGRLTSVAGTVRTLSRTEILLAPLVTNDLERAAQDLDAQLVGFPAYATFTNKHINHDRANSPDVQNLLFPNAAGPGNDLYPGTVRIWSGGGPDGYSIDHNAMVRSLGPYLEFLGREFKNDLDGLRAAAQVVLDHLRDPQQGFLRDFPRWASELVYSSLFALARLIDEITSHLQVLTTEAADGAKRLAVLLTFRQHWYPAGYIQGKLVGYKNLAPGQSEKVFRRTFVKSSRETTSVEEFAATRSQDSTQSLKETAEFLRESSTKFNFTASASGHFDILVAGLDVSSSTSLDLSQMSRETQTRAAESVMKTAVSYNEKREVKVREELSTEDVVEVTSEIANKNQEITANYFYYQLLREYVVRTEFYDVRPVLLRARDLPRSAAIDERFLSNYAHLLIPVLPLQLAVDLQETVHEIDPAVRAMIRRNAEAQERRVTYERARTETPPAAPEERNAWQIRVNRLYEDVALARAEFITAEGQYVRLQSRLDRVITYVRENIAHLMQFIWQNTPSTDHNRILAEETFAGAPLPELTRGLMRVGFYGNEEMYEYDGPSVACLDALVSNMRGGDELLRQDPAELRASPAYQLLSSRYSTESEGVLRSLIGHTVFVLDPAGAHRVLDERVVQLAQDALVVETLPGQVPLLEGYKLVHRALDAQRVCLENSHLRERIRDRPWKTDEGKDSYGVYRRDGVVAPAGEEK